MKKNALAPQPEYFKPQASAKPSRASKKETKLKQAEGFAHICFRGRFGLTVDPEGKLVSQYRVNERLSSRRNILQTGAMQSFLEFQSPDRDLRRLHSIGCKRAAEHMGTSALSRSDPKASLQEARNEVSRGWQRGLHFGCQDMRT